MAGLPWIKVWTAIGDHPKVQRLEKELGVRDALGLVVRLWCWTADYCPSGDIPSADAPAAARAARGEACRKASSVVITALVTAGLLDPTDSGYRVHDWHDMQTTHADAEEKRKVQAAARQAAYRARHGIGVKVTPSGNRDVTRDVTHNSVTEIEKEREIEKEIPCASVSRLPAQGRAGATNLGPLSAELVTEVERGLGKGLLPFKTQSQADALEAIVSERGVASAYAFVAATCRSRDTDPQSVAWILTVLQQSSDRGGVQ